MIDGVDDVEPRSGLAGLVRLEMADQVPAQLQIGGDQGAHRVHFRKRFLDFVFTEITLTGFCGGAHEVGREGFRDGDEPNRRGVTTRAAGGSLDARADVGKTSAELGGIHLLLDGRRMPFAVAAFGPLGASFRYVSNSPAAPFRLPSFTSAMPSW